MSTIHDVAQAAGVSTATVSRALRGLPRVSEPTRARVLRAAAQLHYVVSPTAASLASGKTRVVGVVVPYLARWYFAGLIRGAATVLREHGFHVLLLDVGSAGATRSHPLDPQTLWKRVDAVLVLSLELLASERELLRDLGVPVVTVGVEVDGWDCVRIDDVSAAETATAHLAELGHRRIAHVGGDESLDVHVTTPADRRAGYERTMARYSLDVDPRCVLVTDWTVHGGWRAGERLLELATPPTAVFAASDEIAMGVLFAARRGGRRVPEDLSVVGIDDHELAEFFGLSTVAQFPALQGRMAVDILMDVLNPGHREPVASNTPLPYELIVRSSTARPVRPAE
jgi:LacI family transcriptional regulator, repressor for deo operon, udp, cdd, tsx, nupC, and nupG